MHRLCIGKFLHFVKDVSSCGGMLKKSSRHLLKDVILYCVFFLSVMHRLHLPADDEYGCAFSSISHFISWSVSLFCCFNVCSLRVIVDIYNA